MDFAEMVSKHEVEMYAMTSRRNAASATMTLI
jgi:hypothetical protein